MLSAAYEHIGASGEGFFTQLGGTNVVSNKLLIGSQSGGSGIYTLSAGFLSSSNACVGYTRMGTFNQTGGTCSVFETLSLGYYGFYNLRETGLLSASTEFIGEQGIGTFNQTGGINLISSDLILGYYGGSSGTYNIEGGKLILRSLQKGYGAAQFNFGGGTLQASDNFTTALDMTLTGTGGNAKIDTAGYAVTLSGVLSGSGGLEKRGAGTLILSGNNTYTGETIVSEGILRITSDYTSGGIISVADGAGLVFGTPYGYSSALENTTGQAGSGTSGEIVAVPEPATLVLFAATLFGIVMMVRKNKV